MSYARSDVLTPSGRVPATEYTAYTSTGMRTIVDAVVAYNTDTAVRTVTAKIVGSGETSGQEHVLDSCSLMPGKRYGFPGIVGQTLGIGDKVTIEADAANVVNFRMSGRKVTG